ncbi:hypothetical protein PG991_015946 [Apiospora marii]|uniref:Antifungal protein n=1 Tax=Apiospora marii TaxID=335849 RepID=A0ABR1R047_9PEZI
MQFTTAALSLLAAMGAIAIPLNTTMTLETQGEMGMFITYPGKCTLKTQTCRYKGQNGQTTLAKCPKSPANKRCFGDGHSCSFDSVTRKVSCS